jgi:hypothetical protein
MDKTWLAPGKIQINKINPGKEVKQIIQIHNGSQAAAAFSVYYRTPDYTEDGYAAAPAAARDWINIAESSALLAPQETKYIAVVLNIPVKTLTPERWEFWVGVKENKDSSLAAELCSRWLITMNEY